MLLYTTGIFYHFNHSNIYINASYNVQLYMAHSPCFNLPLLVSPFVSLLLTWNPPSCDGNRPPQSQVACKLTPLVPHLAPVPSPPKFQPFSGFPGPNVHLIRATLQTQPLCSRTLRISGYWHFFRLAKFHLYKFLQAMRNAATFSAQALTHRWRTALAKKCLDTSHAF